MPTQTNLDQKHSRQFYVKGKPLDYWLSLIDDVDTFCLEVLPFKEEFRLAIRCIRVSEMIDLLEQAFKIDQD